MTDKRLRALVRFVEKLAKKDNKKDFNNKKIILHPSRNNQR